MNRFYLILISYLVFLEMAGLLLPVMAFRD